MFSAFLPRWVERRLLTSGGRRVVFYTIAHNLYTLLAGGFEIALILRLTGSFERIVFFNLLFYVLLYFAFVGGTLLIRSGKASRGFRLDLTVQVLACGYMMLNFSHLGNSLILAGFFVFKGVSEGLFWSTRHSALVHCVADDRRDHWSLALQTISIIMGIVLPVLSGFAISYWVIPPQLVHLERVVALQRAPRKTAFVVYLTGASFASLSVAFSVGILNFHVLKTEFQLGLFASWVAAASAVFFFGIRRLVQKFALTRVKMVFLGTTGEFLSRLILSLFITVPGLVAKSLVDSFIVPLRSLFGENILRRRVELLSTGNGMSVAEVTLFQETILMLARTACCLTLIAALQFTTFDPIAVARFLLGLFLVYPFIDFLLLRAIDRGNHRLG